MDGHSWWPLFENIPTEYLEAYYPMRIDGYTTITDSGGPGLHRGGNGVEKRYVYLEPGEVSIHDDRWLTRAVGRARRLARVAVVEAPAPRGRHRAGRCPRSATTSSSSRETCSSTAPRAAAAGRTGSTGPPRSSPATSPSGSSAASSRKEGYGVVLADDGSVDEAATEAERERQRTERGDAPAFDFGPPLEDVDRQLPRGDRSRAAADGDAAALVAARARRGRAGTRAGGRRRLSGDGLERRCGTRGSTGAPASAGAPPSS